MWCQFDSGGVTSSSGGGGGVFSCGGGDGDSGSGNNGRHLEVFTGRVALITGGGRGIGFVAAESLALKGFTVVLLCRDKDKGDKAVGELRYKAKSQEVYLLQCDLESFAEVRRAAEEFRKRFGRLDVLINNASVNPYEYTQRRELKKEEGSSEAEGIELAFGVNYLSHFLLSILLLDLLQSSYLNPPRELLSEVISSHSIIPSAIFNSSEKGDNLSGSNNSTNQSYHDATLSSSNDSVVVVEAINPFGTSSDTDVVALLDGKEGNKTNGTTNSSPTEKPEKKTSSSSKKSKKKSTSSIKRKQQEDSLKLVKSWPTRIISICYDPEQLVELGDSCFDFNDLQLSKDKNWDSALAVLRSKLALLYMTFELSSRIASKEPSNQRYSVYGCGARVAVVALDPSEVLESPYQENAGFFQKIAVKIRGCAIEEAAQAYVRLATAPLQISNDHTTTPTLLSGKIFDIDFEEQEFLPPPKKEVLKRLWDESCKLLSLDQNADVPLPSN